MPAHGASSEAITEAKRAWRQRVRRDRRERAAGRDRDPVAVEQDRWRTALALSDGVLAGAASLLAALPGGGGCVAAYRALPTEPPTQRLLETLAGLGIPVLLPELLADKDLAWNRVDPDGSPATALDPMAIATAALIVVPALAVDRLGGRLGQGGGSYDRALRRADPSAPIVALLFDGEFSRSPVPTLPHDARVTAVVTPQLGWRALPAPGADTGD